ncbi:MAG: hypothetical protein OXT69_07745 [Candidatus Poribacteria bacterium]|nr:hypothetical protein [Candidatus Poribacteria bacterium]
MKQKQATTLKTTDLAKLAEQEGIGMAAAAGNYTPAEIAAAAVAGIDATAVGIDTAAVAGIGTLGSSSYKQYADILAESCASQSALHKQYADAMARYDAKQSAQMREIQEQFRRIGEDTRKNFVNAITHEVLRRLSRGLSRELSHDDDSLRRSNPRDEII